MRIPITTNILISKEKLMRKLFSFAVLAVALTCLYACSSKGDSPEAVVKKSITALQKGNYDAFAATYDLSESDRKQLAGMAEEKISKSINEKGGIKSFKITDTQINGEEAIVNVHMIYNDGSEEDDTMKLKKVDGEWKQIFGK